MTGSTTSELASPGLALDTPRGACRLCGATAGQHVVGPERTLGLGQSLVRCGVCAGSYLDPDLAPDAHERFYGGVYRRIYTTEAARRPQDVVESLRMREVSDWRAARLLPALPEGARLLEVGSGYGAFLGRLHARRPDVALVAVEPDRASREVATDGAPVVFLDTPEAAEAHGPFHIVVLYHVLEHLREPGATLEALSGMLVPGGRLVIEVPDEGTDWADWSRVHPAHLSYFTRPSLERLLARAGLEPAEPAEPANTLSGTLYVEAVKAADRAAAPEPADRTEVAALDARFSSLRWRRRDALKRALKRAAVALVGPERVGDWQRRRVRGALDRQLAALRPAQRVEMLGVTLDPLPVGAVVARAREAMRTRRPLRHADVNVAKLVAMRGDPRLNAAVAASDLVSPDGMGIVWGARLIGLPRFERVAGIDLMQRLVALCAEEGFRPFFLGARPEVVEQAVLRLKARHPGLVMAGWHHGHYTEAEEPQVVEAIRAAKADCLFVAMGSPRQEMFLDRHFTGLGVPYVMCVGGSLDVIAGLRRRAPRWMQKSGLEWFARMVQEPRRLGPRYLVTNTRFALLLARAMLRL